MNNKIKVIYDGEYPNLCRGNLTVIINEKVYEFPEYCLESAGSVSFNNEYDDCICMGDWNIVEWPIDFPETLKGEVLSAINNDIPHGCCGGCV